MCIRDRQRVVDPELRLAIRQRQQWGPLLGGVLVDEHGVPLHEGAALAVLTGEAYRGALHEQGAKGDQFAHAPVDPALAHHLGAALHEGLELGVHGEALGRVDPDVTDCLLYTSRCV